MDANRSLRVSFDLYVWGANGKPHPRDVVDPALLDPRPVASKWVPQSIADQIWMLYEFATPEDRDRVLAMPPTMWDGASLSTKPQDFFDHWTK